MRLLDRSGEATAVPGTYRLVLEELEVHFTGNETSVAPGQTPPPAGRRLVHTDVIPLV